MTRGLAAAAYRRRHGHRRDVLAFGEDGHGEALDPIHGNACHSGHILEGLACPDPRLNVAGVSEVCISISSCPSRGRSPRNAARSLSSASIMNSSPLSVATIKDFPSGLSPTSRAVRIRRGGSSCGVRSSQLTLPDLGVAGGARLAGEPGNLGRVVLSVHARASARKPATRGELRASGYVSRRTKAELRDNLLERLRSGATAFPGIVGFDATVLPELESAVLAGHDLVILGERGQGKTRLMRTLAGLLDEWSPQVAGCEIHDDPYEPVCVRCRSLAAELGDELPVDWRHRDERYTEKLATPDTSVGDLIGDVDPVKVAQGRTLGDPETVHYGLVPRANRVCSVSTSCPTWPSASRSLCSTSWKSATSRCAATRCDFPSISSCSPRPIQRTIRIAAESSHRSRTDSAPSSYPLPHRPRR